MRSSRPLPLAASWAVLVAVAVLLLLLGAAIAAGQVASFDFDGSADYYNEVSASSTNIGAGDFSLCSWIRCDDPAGNALILYAGDTANAEYVRLIVEDGSPCSDDVLRGVIDDGSLCNVCGSTDVCDNAWHFVCYVAKRGVDVELWVDAAQETESPSETCSARTASIPDGEISIGAWCGGTCPEDVFDGNLSHPQIYRTALSGEQQKELMRCPALELPGVDKRHHYSLTTDPAGAELPDLMGLHDVDVDNAATASSDGPPVSSCAPPG